MAVWKHACKTMQGMELDLKLLSRDGATLKLTKARAGSGSVSPTQLMTLTDVMEPVQELALLAAVECMDEQTVRLPVILKNADVEKSYDMRQLGVYAEDPDKGEILYIALQSEEAETVPTAAESKDFTLEWYLNLSVGNAEHVEVAIRETCTLTVEEGDARYVRKETGKGLSSNDYTDEEKEKLAGVASGANVNVQADWNALDEKSDAFIKNKPAIPIVPAALKNPQALTFTGGVTGTYDGSAAKSVAIPVVPTALKNPNALTFTGGVTGTYDGSAAKSVAIPAAGAASPKAAGTASAGAAATFSRSDHVHPLQTSVSGSSGSCTGNAASATKATNDGNGNVIADTYAKKEWGYLGNANGSGGTLAFKSEAYSEILINAIQASSGGPTILHTCILPSNLFKTSSNVTFTVCENGLTASVGNGNITIANKSSSYSASIYAR